jgi:hypothetical protein
MKRGKKAGTLLEAGLNSQEGKTLVFVGLGEGLGNFCTLIRFTESNHKKQTYTYYVRPTTTIR